MTADNTRPADGEFVTVPKEATDLMLVALTNEVNERLGLVR